MAVEGAPGRRHRSDAVRNDGRVLAAAHDVLAEVGPHASMEQIAGRAGVGVGTIYRRFASKDALIDALVQQLAEDVAEAAADAHERQEGSGLERFLDYLGETLSSSRQYAELLLDREVDPATTARLRAAIADLVESAVSAGELRQDARAEDVLLLVRALTTVIHHSADEQGWRRFVRIHLSGLRRS